MPSAGSTRNTRAKRTTLVPVQTTCTTMHPLRIIAGTVQVTHSKAAPLEVTSRYCSHTPSQEPKWIGLLNILVMLLQKGRGRQWKSRLRERSKHTPTSGFQAPEKQLQPHANPQKNSRLKASGVAPLLELAAGGLVGVGEQVVVLGEGAQVHYELARDLIPLQRLASRHVIQLCSQRRPQLARVRTRSVLCFQTQQDLAIFDSPCCRQLRAHSMLLGALSTSSYYDAISPRQALELLQRASQAHAVIHFQMPDIAQPENKITSRKSIFGALTKYFQSLAGERHHAYMCMYSRITIIIAEPKATCPNPLHVQPCLTCRFSRTCNTVTVRSAHQCGARRRRPGRHGGSCRRCTSGG